MEDPPKYGANITRNQFIGLVFALCLGTLAEWYDFSVYTQLSPQLTELFFPPNNPSVAQLSFFSVYAIGYLARPLGALIFGHIGDAFGRRLTLLISVLMITVPTLLIGCLPTYAMVGLAAPILMAILRFVQGIAVGGEFGSAITYLYEVAPAGRKGLTASWGQVAVSPGMILGILMCQAVLYGCTHDQMLLWGWRVPFLLTVFTTPLALYLRMHMPEPFEFLQHKQELVLQRVASTAASRVARSFTRQHSALSSSNPHGSFTGQQLLRVFSSMRSSSLTHVHAPMPAHGAAGPDVGAAAAATSPKGQQPLRQLSTKQLSLQLRRSVSITADGRLVPDAGTFLHHDGAEQQEAGVQALGCEQEFQQEVQALSATMKHHIPMEVLFREHWAGVLLQFLLEAAYGTAFYTFFTYMPSYMSKELHVPASNTLWSLLIGLVLFAVTVPLAGHFVGDTKLPCVWSLLVATGVIAAAIMPVMQLAGHPVGLWLLMPLMLGLVGVIGGIMTTVGPAIFPSAVRASGYNLGHNLAMSIFGGLSPLIISALAVVIHPASNAAGVVVVMTALLTFGAGVVLVKVVPWTNASAPAGSEQQHLQEQAAKHQEVTAMQQVVVPAA